MLSDVAPPGAVAADAFWLILALAVGSALVDWLNKRRQKAEEQSEPLPPALAELRRVPIDLEAGTHDAPLPPEPDRAPALASAAP